MSVIDRLQLAFAIFIAVTFSTSVVLTAAMLLLGY
jgi:hypothetical protein